MDLKILYEDNHLIVVVKPAGILSQADNTNDSDMLTLLKNYIKEKYMARGRYCRSGSGSGVINISVHGSVSCRGPFAGITLAAGVRDGAMGHKIHSMHMADEVLHDQVRTREQECR